MKTSIRIAATLQVLLAWVWLGAQAPGGQEQPPPAQDQSLAQRDELFAQSQRHAAAGNLDEAVAAAEQAMAIEREVFGDVHAEIAGSLEYLALIHLAREEFESARRCREEALEILATTEGAEHWRVTDARLALEDVGRLAMLTAADRIELARAAQLNRRAGRQFQAGNAADAVALLGEALDIRRKLLGEQHRDVGESLNNLAFLYHAMADYARAEPLFVEALETWKNLVGERHPDYATSLNNLAELYRAIGDNARAEPLYVQSLEIRKNALGEQNPQYAVSLNNLAVLYEAMGDYSRAEPLYVQSLEIRKNALGEQNPQYATSLNNLAGLFVRMGDYYRAEPLLVESLEITKNALGEQHPEHAGSLQNLAYLFVEMGDYARAEPLIVQALEISNNTLGKQHPHYATILNNLAALYRAIGDYARAEPLYVQALEIRKNALGEQHPDYGGSLNNLAYLYVQMGDYARAEPLVAQALEIKKNAVGEQHPDYATSLNNLAFQYMAIGDCAQAEPLFVQALEITKKVVGEQHPDYATSLNNLAGLYMQMGDHARAETFFMQSIEIWKYALGERHPRYAVSLNNLAGLCVQMGDNARAQALALEALGISRTLLDHSAAVQSERQQLAMNEAQRRFFDVYLSAAIGAFGQGHSETAAAVYGQVLAWKGSVTARQQLVRRVRGAATQNEGIEVGRLCDDLDSAARELAALAWGPPAAQGEPGAIARRVVELSDRIDRLEGDLAGASREFQLESELRDRGPDEVAAALPEDTILVDLVEYNELVPRHAAERATWRRRLAGFVLKPGRSVDYVDLGAVDAIAAAVEAWRSGYGAGAVADGDNAGENPGGLLRRLVWEKLAPHLEGAETVLISPDGALARLPWAALPGSEPGTFLIEELSIAVVPVPRKLPELLEPADSSDQDQSLLLIGDVRFDADADAGEGLLAYARAAARPASEDGFLDALGPLPATRDECLAVRDSFKRRYSQGNVVFLREAQPTEEAVRREVPASRYLHLATHGYFAPPQLRSALAASSRGEFEESFGRFDRHDLSGFHPGLLSGVVLAGAQSPLDPARDDGILTALEVGYLDLRNVELATLSACETGLGETAGGEGLLGLQRAFQVAGCKSVVASLWKVHDEVTQKLMISFYDNLWGKGLTKVEALRQAQLAMLNRQTQLAMLDEAGERGTGLVLGQEPEGEHRLPPYYWAGFVLSGDWD